MPTTSDYDQQTGDIWVGYGNGGIGIVNSTGQNVGSVALGTHPESFQFEQNGDRVYVNVPKQFGITVVDRKKRAAVAKWGLGGLFANYPMALDDANKRLFVGCRFPARLVVLDTTSGRIVTSLPTVGDTDDVFYDPVGDWSTSSAAKVRWKFSDNMIKTITSAVRRITTAPGARTGLFVPTFNRLFVAAPHRGPQSARVLVYMVTRN